MRKPIIKWMGGKTRVLGELQKVLPKRTTFVEPFVGAGSVFLNTNYSRYILSDSNPD
ncbi:DNA adenine methylase, partial [Shigella flexneri 2a]